MSSRDDDLVQMVADLSAEVARINRERAMEVGVPTGMVLPNPMRAVPSGYLWADGVAVSRTTYRHLFEAIVPLVGTFTVTLASPGVFTLNSHGLVIGDAVYLTTTGALPTGLSANTIYYVMTVPTANTFTLGASRSTTAVTSAKNTSGSQSGVHSLYHCPWGLGDGSTTFNKPDYRGVTLMGADAFPGGSDRGLLSWLNTVGVQGGEQDHTLTSGESGLPVHGHGDDFAVGKGTLDVSLTDPTHRHYDGDDTGGNTVPDATANGMTPAHQEPGAGTAGSKRTGYASTGITGDVTGAPSLTGSVSNSSAADASSAHNNVQPSTLTYWVVKT